MFYELYELIVPLVVKSVFALNRKHNVGYHNDHDKNQSENVKPSHIIYHYKFLIYNEII